MNRVRILSLFRTTRIKKVHFPPPIHSCSCYYSSSLPSHASGLGSHIEGSSPPLLNGECIAFLSQEEHTIIFPRRFASNLFHSLANQPQHQLVYTVVEPIRHFAESVRLDEACRPDKGESHQRYNSALSTRHDKTTRVFTHK